MTLLNHYSRITRSTLLCCLCIYGLLGLLILNHYVVIQYILNIILGVFVLICVRLGIKDRRSFNWINAMIMLVVTTIIPIDPTLTLLIVSLSGWMPEIHPSDQPSDPMNHDHHLSNDTLLSTKLEVAKLNHLYIKNR